MPEHSTARPRAAASATSARVPSRSAPGLGHRLADAGDDLDRALEQLVLGLGVLAAGVALAHLGQDVGGRAGQLTGLPVDQPRARPRRPRLGPAELLKSMCTGERSRPHAGCATRTGRAAPRAPAAGVSPRWAQADGVATRPCGRAQDEALADEERLVDVLDGLGRLADADGERVEPHRSAPRSARRWREDRPVDLVEAALVDAEGGRAASAAVGGRPCRARAPRRSRAPGAAAGWRCGGAPGARAISRAPVGVDRRPRGCRRPA